MNVLLRTCRILGTQDGWKEERSNEKKKRRRRTAAEKLRHVELSRWIEPIVADVTHLNIAKLAADVDVIVDGTDNFATRFLVNDFCVKRDKPWVYGGCIGAEGQSMTIVPHDTACLACLLPEPPPPGTTPTCDTAGILGPVVGVIGSD